MFRLVAKLNGSFVVRSCSITLSTLMTEAKSLTRDWYIIDDLGDVIESSGCVIEPFLESING